MCYSFYTIDPRRFFESYQKAFGKIRSANQVTAMTNVLDRVYSDQNVQNIRSRAYMLATIKYETGNTWEPVAPRFRFTGSFTQIRFRPRGYVPVVGQEIYGELSAAYRIRVGPWGDHVDFVKDPNLLLEPCYAYWAMSYGMREGIFTGRKLSDFFFDADDNEEYPSFTIRLLYQNARSIIEGSGISKPKPMWCYYPSVAASQIANDAILLEKLLREVEARKEGRG